VSNYYFLIFPFIVLCIHLGLAAFCVDKLSKRFETKVYLKDGWLLIIVFLAIIGPLAYLHNEERD